MRSNASFVPSVARELPRLDRALQLALDRLRLPADLVVEERAALCGLEEADPTLRGAGERGLLVAEQLALDQRRRHRGAVRADDRAPPKRPFVDRLREDFLAGARLAQHEDAERADRKLADVFADRGRGGIDDRHRRRAQRRRLGGARPGARDHEVHLTDLERLANGELGWPALLESFAAHARAVARAEILDRERRREAQPGVPARQRVVRDHDVAVGRAADRDLVAHQRKREQDISRHEQESLAALDAAAHTGRGCLRGVRGHYDPSLTYAGRFYVQIA